MKSGFSHLENNKVRKKLQPCSFMIKPWPTFDTKPVAWAHPLCVTFLR